MTTPRPTCSEPGPARRRMARSRRGVALMLVMIALGVAGASTAFYLASRDNSSAIGANARLMASADWSARSAAEIAVAVMQTSTDWMAKAADGSFGSGITVAGGSVAIVVTDLNGAPPDSEDTDLVVTATATVNGVRATHQRIVRVQPSMPLDQAIDPFLGEFGVYTTSRLEVDNSTVGVWKLSPRARAGAPGKMGLGSQSSSDLRLEASANVSEMGLYVPDNAVGALRSALGSVRLAAGFTMPMPIPAVRAVTPSAFSSLPLANLFNATVSGAGTRQNINGGRHQRLTIQNGAQATMTAGNYSVSNLLLTSAGTLVISGDVRLEVRGNLLMDDRAAIELADSSSRLVVYVAGEVAVQDAAIGVPRAIAQDLSRDPGDIAAYIDPRRVRILGVGTGSRNIQIDTNAIIVGCLHQPHATVVIEAGGSVVGQVVAQRVRIDNGGLVLVDPALDNKCGFTSPRGPLYKANGDPIDGLVAALGSFNHALGLAALPSHIASQVVIPAAPAQEVAADDPTPRSDARTDSRAWPMRAMGLEHKASGGTGRLAGSFADASLLESLLDPLLGDDGLVTDVFKSAQQGLGGLLGGLLP